MITTIPSRGPVPVGLSALPLLILALSLFLVACDSDKQTSTNTGSHDATEAVERALGVMRDLSSYHVSVRAVPAVGPHYESGIWEIDFVAPGTYRFVSLAHYRDQIGCADSDPNVCKPVFGPVTASSLGEIISDETRSFARECDASGSSCSEWSEGGSVLGVPPSAGPTWLPWFESCLVAIELAHDMKIVTSEGADTVSLRGYVNPIEVVRESLSRITGQIYDTMRADELAFYDANPVRLDLLLSSEDYRVLYLDLSGEQLGTLGTYLDGEPVTGTVSVEVEVRFSLFNAVRIEMPTA